MFAVETRWKPIQNFEKKNLEVKEMYSPGGGNDNISIGVTIHKLDNISIGWSLTSTASYTINIKIGMVQPSNHIKLFKTYVHCLWADFQSCSQPPKQIGMDGLNVHFQLDGVGH